MVIEYVIFYEYKILVDFSINNWWEVSKIRGGGDTLVAGIGRKLLQLFGIPI